MSLDSKESPFGVNLTKRLVSIGGENLLYKSNEIVGGGVIELVDYMGGDEMVERVATMGHGRKIFKENPENSDFISHLEASGIYEPFKSVHLKLNIKGPIDSALGYVYETTANVNEYSGRYSVMLDSGHVPSVDEILQRLEGDPNTLESRAIEIHRTLERTRLETTCKYKEIIGIDMARELARTGLGTNNDTQYFWKNDLFSISQFVKKQRKVLPNSSPIREYIETLAIIASKVAPQSWNVLMNQEKNKKINLTIPSDEQVVDTPLSPSIWNISETKRAISPELEKLLFIPQKILDKGEVQAVDYMGNDSSSAEAARTSYGKGTKTLTDDKQLTISLIRDLHTSPIEMGELAFESKVPVFVDPRQAARHRTLDNHGFMGYTPKGSEFYIAPDSEFKYQDRTNRQGRGKGMDESDLVKARELLRESFELELATAFRLRELGASEEIIRAQKGVGFFTKRWRTGDTHNIGHYLMLRMDKHAQKEIRDQAGIVNVLHKAHTPISNSALHDYTINGMRLSIKEIGLLQSITKAGLLKPGTDLENLEIYRGAGFLISVDKNDDSKGKKLSREGKAFKSKLQRILVR